MVKPFSDAVKRWYGTLRPGERRLVFALAAVVFCSFYFSAVLKPAMVSIAQSKKQYQAASDEIQSLRAQYSVSDTVRREIDSIKKSRTVLAAKIKEVESGLIGYAQAQDLVDEIMKLAQTLSIDLVSIKAGIEEESEGFSKLTIDIKFVSGYGKLLSFLRSIEPLGGVVRLYAFEVTQSKNEPAVSVDVSLGLYALLRSQAGAAPDISLTGKKSVLSATAVKNPFSPRFVAGKDKKRILKLTGITYTKDGKATAIINGTIVKTGDVLEGTTIGLISADCVVIDTGMEQQKLFLER